jgi:hypothetical protein
LEGELETLVNEAEALGAPVAVSVEPGSSTEAATA